MKMSKYAKFRQIFIDKYLEIEYQANKDEFELSEILYHSFKRFFLGFLLKWIIIGLTPLTFIIIDYRYISSEPFILSFIGLGAGYILYTTTFLKFSRLQYFHRLKVRIELIKESLGRGLKYDLNEVKELIKSSKPLILEREKTAAKVYHQIKESISASSKTESKLTSPEKLYFLYIFLNYELKIDTTDKEYAYVIGALLGISPDRTLTNYLSKLNLLHRYNNAYKKQLNNNELKELKKTLESVKRYLNNEKHIDSILNSIDLDLKKA